MKKGLILIGTAILLIACAGCGDNSAPKIEESDSGHVVAEVKRPPTETVEWDVTSVRLEDFGMEATRDDPKFEEVFNHTQYVAELWGVQEGDGVELILRQAPGHEPRKIRWRVGHWDIPRAETYFRHLSEINWVPAEPVETAERASVTLVTQRYNLTAYEGTTAVTRTKPDNPEEWLKPDSDDYFDKPYEWILRSWFDELELAYLNAQEIVIPDQGQTWQEAAQAFADAYYGCYAKTSYGSQNHWIYVSTEIEPLEAEMEAAIKADGYLSQDSFSFFLRVVFVPENQRAAMSAMAGNTGDYTGDDPKVPADALEFSRCVTVEKRDDGWHGEIRGTGW